VISTGDLINPRQRSHRPVRLADFSGLREKIRTFTGIEFRLPSHTAASNSALGAKPPLRSTINLELLVSVFRRTVYHGARIWTRAIVENHYSRCLLFVCNQQGHDSCWVWIRSRNRPGQIGILTRPNHPLTVLRTQATVPISSDIQRPPRMQRTYQVILFVWRRNPSCMASAKCRTRRL